MSAPPRLTEAEVRLYCAGIVAALESIHTTDTMLARLAVTRLQGDLLRRLAEDAAVAAIEVIPVPRRTA